MFHLIPKPLHRLLLRIGYRLRHYWRRITGLASDGVVIVGRDFEGQILLLRHSYGPPGWYFPGGGIGRREKAEDAARRELREETGCEIEGLTLIGVVEEILSGAPHRSQVFDGVINSMPLADGREILEARFFPTHSLPEPLSPRTRARLEMWQSRGT